jgi:rod shape-determining protein MreD
MTVAARLVLTLFLVDQAPLGLSLMQLLSTLAAYPLVAALSHLVFRVRKLAPGDLATRGQAS